MTGRHFDEARHGPIGRCAPCNKGSFASRKAARRWAKSAHPNQRMQAYRCRAQEGMWHYGHYTPPSRRGLRRRERAS